MQDYEDLKKIIQEDEYIYVFLIETGISLLLGALFKEKFSIKREKIFFVSRRYNSSYLLDAKYFHKLSSTFLLKLYCKFFNNPTGTGGIESVSSAIESKEWIENFKKEFIFITPWFSPETTIIAKSKFCKKIIHIEEGSQAYQKVYTFDSKKISDSERLKSHKLGYGKNIFWSKEAIYYLAMSKGSFPYIQNSKKVILGNKENIKKIYKPKLLNIKNIGLMPTPQRLSQNDFLKGLRKLIKLLPKYSKIKLHPATYVNKILLKLIYKELNLLGLNEDFLIDQSILLEAEMIFDIKNIYGPGSSLSIYAKALMSKYNKICFEGYIYPNYKHL